MYYSLILSDVGNNTFIFKDDLYIFRKKKEYNNIILFLNYSDNVNISDINVLLEIYVN